MRPTLLAAALGAALLAPAAALACGAIFTPTEASAGAAFETQTVLVHRLADRVDLHVRMTVAPGAQAFSWVLPAPAGAELSLGDDDLFDDLDDLTRPIVDIEFVGSNGGCSAADGAAGGAGPRDLDVLEVGRIGEYDYAIIATGDAAAAVQWLTDNGFAVPEGSEAAMQPYADAGMNFIGVRLTHPEGVTGGTRPTPLVLSTPDASNTLPTYPLGLSALSAGQTLPVLIYVLGPQRAAVQGGERATVADVADRILDRRYLEYDDAVDLMQEEATGPLWITDAAILDPAASQSRLAALGPESSRAVLTRLYARLPAEGIVDVNLTWYPEGQAAVDPFQHRTYGDPDGGCAAAIGGPVGAPWLLLLLIGGWRVRRRRR